MRSARTSTPFSSPIPGKSRSNFSPFAFRAPLREEPVSADFDTHDSTAIAPYLAYAADGDVTGPIVYVNYALPADFDGLAALKVDLRGRIGM